jgi:hypothetical protein
VAFIHQRTGLQLQRGFHGGQHFRAAWMTNESRHPVQPLAFQETLRGRGQALFDKARQRTRQHDAKADRIDRPSHHVERAGPQMLARGADLQSTFLAVRPQHGSGGAVAKQRRGNHIGLAADAIAAESQRAKLDHHHQHDGARPGARQLRTDRHSGHAAGAAEPEHRQTVHVGTESHPFRHPCLNAGRGDAGGGNGDDHIDIAGGKPRALERLLRRLDEKRFGALEIGRGPLRPVAHLVEPVDRPDRIAPFDPGIGENVGQARIAAEQALENLLDTPGNLGLLEAVRRHRGGQRQHRNRFGGRPGSGGMG